MKPYYERGKVSIFHGNSLDVLREMKSESVHCAVTSPPYWGLRDYNCAGQIGLEATPELFIAKMVGVFRELRRVLRNDGTLWVNIGDSYARSGGAQGGGNRELMHLEGKQKRMCSIPRQTDLKQKDLVGIPWMLAFALRADGWYLRQDIIWNKSNPMPESITDRCTKAHEYVFLLSKSQRYFYNVEAVKEPVTGGAHARGEGVNPKAKYKMPDGWDTGPGGHGSFHRNGREKGKTPGKNSRIHVDRDPAHALTAKQPRQNESFSAAVRGLVETRNKRSVWTVATEAFAEAHFATFPQELIKPCILAGCPAGGTVLDPFMGSGTTALVARDLSCKAVGIELNSEYIEIAAKRLSQEVFDFSEVSA